MDEELAAHVAPGSPARAAKHWLRLVLVDRDIAEAWPLTTRNLRLALVQNLMWDNRDQLALAGFNLNSLADRLAGERPSHPHWPGMKRGLLRVLRTKWKDVPPLDELGVLRSRVVDATHELVLFADAALGEIPPGATAPVVPLLMAHGDTGWLVAGFGKRLPEPGWPPRFREGHIVLS